MPQFHLGVIATGGFDLGAFAFIAFVFAQLLAMVLLRRFEANAQGAQQTRPRDTDPGRVVTPPIQPALQS